MAQRTHHHGSVFFGAACGVATLVAFASAQSLAAQPEPASPITQPLTIPAGQIELARLLDLVGQRLKLNIDYDAASLKGVVTLRLEAGMTDTELWALLNRVLAVRGFTTVRMPGPASYSVVKVSEAPGVATVKDVAAEGPAEPPPGFRMEVVRVQHRSGREVIDAISKVLSKPIGSVVQLGDGGLLMIADLSPRVDLALELLHQLDSSSAQAVVEEVPLRYLGAIPMAALVSQVTLRRDQVSGEKTPGEVLASPTGNGLILVCPEASRASWLGLIAQLDRRESVETMTYSPRTFAVGDVARLIEQSVRDPAPGAAAAAGEDRWRLVVDDLTGSLIITATASEHGRIRELLARLDSVPSAARRPVRSFKIRNRSVTELKAVLDSLLQAGVVSAAADQGAAPTGAAALTPGLAPQPTDPVVPPVNSLTPATAASNATPLAGDTAMGVPANRALARRSAAGAGNASRGEGAPAPYEPPLVLTCDEGTSTLIAVGEPRLLAQLAELIKALDVRQPQVMLEVILLSLSEAQTISLGIEITKSVDLNDDTKADLLSLFGLSTAAANGARAIAGDPLGFTGLVLNPGNFSILVRALETLNDGRSVSKPRLLVTNNQQAVFSSVLQQPVATTSTNNTSTVTAFGGTQDAGTTATIRPQIAEGDHLILEYDVKLSAFTGNSPGEGLPPPRQQNQVHSTVTIPDGFTVVVGGLELVSETKGTSQIPLIGDIPGLGELFKNRNNANSRSRFFVFIRANVLRQASFDDLKYLSEADTRAAKIDDGFPQVHPRIIR
ncbi:MAG: hypothetical protein KF745_14075 [Phycisphaeraceae bacterium]|nr:hypothetical protein [Phycisphaeraceae bacterium]